MWCGCGVAALPGPLRIMLKLLRLGAVGDLLISAAALLLLLVDWDGRQLWVLVLTASKQPGRAGSSCWCWRQQSARRPRWLPLESVERLGMILLLRLMMLVWVTVRMF